MKIVFAGSPAFAVPALERLLNDKKDVVAVITQPDKIAGRKKVLTPVPLKEYALSQGLPVYDFAKIRDNVPVLKSLGADIMITCAYGQLLTAEVLACFPEGVWNIHASLLPLFRGASPIQSAILAGERYTGVTVMKTELSLDTGDILLVKRCEIGDMTCGELSQKLAVLGAEAIAEGIGYLEKGNAQLLMQDEARATLCKKITKADAKIDFCLPAEEIVRKIRAFNPEPLAYCLFNGTNLNLLNAEPAEGTGDTGKVIRADKSGIYVACGGGATKITELQPAGGKKMRACDFVNGRKIKESDVLE